MSLVSLVSLVRLVSLVSLVSTARRTLARLRATLSGHDGGSADAELRAEMEAHLEMAIEEHVCRGLPPDEARRRALLESGGLTHAARLVHEQRGLPWVERLAADASYAVRHFRHTPVATVTMLLVLSLGLGTNVVLFTVMNSLVTLPAPGIARDAALVRVRGSVRATRTTSEQARLLSWPEVQAYAARTELFDRVAAHADETALVDLGGDAGGASSGAIAARVVYATPNYFDVLGVRPALGTVPVAEPDVTRLTTSPTAVISDAMWKRRFGAARDVVGRVVRVNDVPVEIVGVAPPRFLGTGGGTPGNGAMTMWVPLAAYPALQKRTAAAFLGVDSLFLSAFARLRPGATAASAATVVAGIAARTRGGADSTSADVVPMRAGNSRVSQRADQLLSAAVSGAFALLVLLVTCTNVSALMVGLAVARRREIGVRLALGAPRTRLIRQLLTESVLLSLAAAAVGLAATALGIRVVGAALDDVQLVVDWRVTAATCAVALVTGVLFGLSPALHATRVSVGEVMKGVARTTSAARSRLQRALVVVQIALTQPLLVGLGVVVATVLSGVGTRTPAAVADRIAEVELDPWAGRLAPDALAARIDAVVARVGALPGVVAALPMQLGTIGAPLVVHPDDRVVGVTGGVLDAQMTAAPRSYFDAYGIRVVRGRDFTAGERTPPTHDPSHPVSYDVVIVASDLARRLWGVADPIGRRLVLAGSDGERGMTMTVVGVVDADAAGPNDDPARTRVYVPYAAMNTGVLARTVGPAAPMLDALRRAVAAEAPQLPIVRAQTTAERETAFRRDVLRAGGAAAGGGLLALLLSAMGLFAVVSFAVAQRTAEIGVRTALGARRGQVVRLFFAQGLALSALGLVVGLPLSVIASRYVAGVVHWSPTRSPLLGAAIALVVLAVASVAVWIPARRASAVDPIVALRTE